MIGINAIGTAAQQASKSLDTVEIFTEDTLKSGSGACLKELVDTIVSQSADAVSFLTSLGMFGRQNNIYLGREG